MAFLNKKSTFIIFACLFGFISCNSSDAKKIENQVIIKDSIPEQIQNKKIIVGAQRTHIYFPILKNKNVAVVANQTSMIENCHLVDSLFALEMKIKKIFCPEHGFRGNADAGEVINNTMDTKTGLPIVSLYGNNKKPSNDELKNIEIIIFDLQDVGARFYTYISTMHYIMEACAENNVKLIILDRPNPNGYYVDGPVLEPALKSFIGMHPVPVVHGMTVGEYAQMINGEKWLKNELLCDLQVITCENYTHKFNYSLPVKPSPNLPNDRSVELYPSICFFEGTNLSVGRGTNMQFQVVGHPLLKKVEGINFSFIPKPNEGAKNPLLNGEECFGFDFRIKEEQFDSLPKLNLNYFIYAYSIFPDKSKFFLKNNMFDLLAGNKSLKKQIIEGKNYEEIRKSWQPDLEKFKQIRKKYLLYEDFEP
ncbi:MAG: DUF1343 domain-containing protein [Bacteroidales bacterium]|nr:DUF1343 domain-containing protein [Bacteroidales bacterium]